MTNVIKLISLFLDIIDLIWISLGDGSIYLFRIIPLELSSLVVFFFGFYKFCFSHYHVFVRSAFVFDQFFVHREWSSHFRNYDSVYFFSVWCKLIFGKIDHFDLHFNANS